jgi:uncharacterized protein YjbJ (UPF0337 family)
MSTNISKEIEDTIDKVAGAGTTDTIEGKAKETLGKIQASAGDAVKDHKLEARGIVNQADGKIQQATGEIKGGLEDLRDRAQNLLEDTVETIKDKAHSASEAIKSRLHEATEPEAPK